MIQITLQFTSIETAIAVLRGIPETALASLPVVEKAAEVTPGKPSPEKPAKDVAKVAPKSETKAESKPAAPAADTSSADKPADASDKADEGVLDYGILQKAVFALAAKSRDAAMAMNKQFGVANMKELPEGKRRDALAAVQAKIIELAVAEKEVA